LITRIIIKKLIIKTYKIVIDNTANMSKKSSSSKYHEDPEYRRKHLEYISEKITCECGITTTRGNLSHHRGTNKHKTWIREQKDNQLSDTIQNLFTEIKELKKEIKRINKQLNE
jgi:hypothetical protein